MSLDELGQMCEDRRYTLQFEVVHDIAPLVNQVQGQLGDYCLHGLRVVEYMHVGEGFHCIVALCL
jgi:hypothetical protein